MMIRKKPRGSLEVSIGQDKLENLVYDYCKALLKDSLIINDLCIRYTEDGIKAEFEISEIVKHESTQKATK